MRGRAGSLQVVTTPTFDRLAEYAQSCTRRMLVSSPYVNNGIKDLTSMVSPGVSRILITRTDLRDFAVGSSSLDTLCSLASEGVVIRSVSNLHAKVYIFDDAAALVTSANATTAGMWRNLECGLSTDDRCVVKQLTESLLSGFGLGAKPRSMKQRELEALYAPVEDIKVSLPERGRGIPPDSALEVPATFSIKDTGEFLGRFSGWKRLVLESVLEMPEDTITLRNLYGICVIKANERFPGNSNMEAQVRRQLQELTAIGIVERVKRGYYRLTMEQA